MKIFYDTEFIDDGKTIDLISIGMVAEDGREYYAVSSEFNWNKAMASEWLRQNVIVSLPTVIGPKLNRHHPLVKQRKVIADDIKNFLTGPPGIELWAYYGAYDHVALAQLYGAMISLPSCVPMFTHDIKQFALSRCVGELPQQASGNHNALEDARHNKVMYDFILSS